MLQDPIGNASGKYITAKFHLSFAGFQNNTGTMFYLDGVSKWIEELENYFKEATPTYITYIDST